MAVIETDNLTKWYGKRCGIQNIELTVHPGEIFGFLGPNGAGKSTAIRVLLGFLRATSGTARILGDDCWKHSATVRRNVGYVPGDVRMYSWLTLRKALKIVGEVRRSDIASHGRELAERFDLEHDLPVRKMSRGNRQKLALVLALAHRPQVAILDEPTSGLDPLMQNVLMACMREMASEGRTVFFSSHTLSEVESSCARVAIIRDGNIVACDELEKLRRSAPRVVNIIFESSESAESAVWPEFLRLQSRHGKLCEVHMDGPAAELIAWSSRQAIADIDISPPRLEAVFRSYYRGGTSEMTS